MRKQDSRVVKMMEDRPNNLDFAEWWSSQRYLTAYDAMLESLRWIMAFVSPFGSCCVEFRGPQVRLGCSSGHAGTAASASNLA